MSREIQFRPHPKLGAVPTGMALARACLAAGKYMLEAPTRDVYLVRRELFFELLQCADNDAIAAPFLAAHVQSILDEESRKYHEGTPKG